MNIKNDILNFVFKKKKTNWYIKKAFKIVRRSEDETDTDL